MTILLVSFLLILTTRSPQLLKRMNFLYIYRFLSELSSAVTTSGTIQPAIDSNVVAFGFFDTCWIKRAYLNTRIIR